MCARMTFTALSQGACTYCHVSRRLRALSTVKPVWSGSGRHIADLSRSKEDACFPTPNIWGQKAKRNYYSDSLESPISFTTPFNNKCLYCYFYHEAILGESNFILIIQKKVSVYIFISFTSLHTNNIIPLYYNIWWLVFLYGWAEREMTSIIFVTREIKIGEYLP